MGDFLAELLFGKVALEQAVLADRDAAGFLADHHGDGVGALGEADGGAVAAPASAGLGPSAPLGVFLQDWLEGMLRLCAKVFVIVMGVMVLIEAMKAFSLVDRFIRVFAPVLRMMGLHQRAGMLWLTSVLFGLAYAGAVIVEESA